MAAGRKTGPRTPSDSSCCTDVTDPPYKDLWHVCAGPCFTMPRIGERLFYFPMVPLHGLPSKILCWMRNVLLRVEQDTDEMFAHISLVPDSLQSSYIRPLRHV
ncbi:hypothetical protein SUGI_0553120 [Cryptomeria japonica]|nr:hypothetical protein SUGI_0553120 [Cryptomeria japonica]